MAYKNKNINEEQRFADSILTQNRGMVRLTELDPKERLKIAGRWVEVADIPLNAVFLSCGHPMRGIALAEGNVVFCESCKDNVFVASVN
jgi:hypothetical protein